MSEVRGGTCGDPDRPPCPACRPARRRPGDLLADPLADPFAQELVLVPARGVERWLSQRLSHRLGPPRAARTGSAPGCSSGRPPAWSPRSSGDPRGRPVVAGRAGLAAARRCSTPAPASPGAARSARTSATATPARRPTCGAAGATPSPAGWRGCSRRTPCSGRRCSPTGSRPTTPTAPAERSLPTSPGSPSCGVGWSPRSARRRRAAAPRRPRRAARRPGAIDLPPRLSLFGHTRIPVTEVELLAALGEHRDVHLWLPASLRRALARAGRPAGRGAARPTTARTSGSAIRCSPRSAATCASCSGRLTGRVGRADGAASVSSRHRRGHPARLAAARPRRQRHRRPGLAHADPDDDQRPGARLPRPGPPGRGAARGAARPARRRPRPSSRATSW